MRITESTTVHTVSQDSPLIDLSSKDLIFSRIIKHLDLKGYFALHLSCKQAQRHCTIFKTSFTQIWRDICACRESERPISFIKACSIHAKDFHNENLNMAKYITPFSKITSLRISRFSVTGGHLLNHLNICFPHLTSLHLQNCTGFNRDELCSITAIDQLKELTFIDDSDVSSLRLSSFIPIIESIEQTCPIIFIKLMTENQTTGHKSIETYKRLPIEMD